MPGTGELIFHTITGLMSVIFLVIMGYLALGGSFAPGLLYVGSVGLLGAMSYIFLLGKVERRAG